MGWGGRGVVGVELLVSSMREKRCEVVDDVFFASGHVHCCAEGFCIASQFFFVFFWGD